MGEEKTEEKVLGLNVIVDFAMMYPEELHGIQRLGKLEWRFRIGVEGPGFWLRFHAISQSYTLDYFSLNSTQAANLVKTLKHVYLNELGKNIAACSPKFADFRKKLLGHFEVKPEREAGANVEMGGANCLTTYTVSFYNGAYRIRRQATGEEILAATSYKEALKIARLMNAEHYGFQRQQEGDAR